jgi:hypothetical protein
MRSNCQWPVTVSWYHPRHFNLCFKWRTQGSLWLAYEIAARCFLGYTPPTSETVSMTPFRLGTFKSTSWSPESEPIFGRVTMQTQCQWEAGQAGVWNEAGAHHTLAKVRRECGYGRHVLASQLMVEEREGPPSFFTDPSYAKSMPGKVSTSNSTTVSTRKCMAALSQGSWRSKRHDSSQVEKVKLLMNKFVKLYSFNVPYWRVSVWYTCRFL